MKFLILGCNGMAGHLISLYLKEQGHDVFGFDRTMPKYVTGISGDARDIALIKNNKATLPTSINIGTIDIYYAIAKALREKYYDAKIDVEKIQDYLDKGFYYKGELQDISFAINTTKTLFKQIYVI